MLRYILYILLVLVAVILGRALVMPSKESTYVAQADDRALPYAEKLSEMIRCETVTDTSAEGLKKFDAFHKKLEDLFPAVHNTLERTVIDGNLLYRWKGESSEKPVVLMSHQDVVPAEGEWSHEPFGGEISDGKVWGRGAIDTKSSQFAIFQAVDELVSEGYVPANDVYISSSCTEEINGDGCPALVAYLKEKGVKPFMVCDEGGGIINEPVGGIHGNFAMVGIFEKGKADIKLTARSSGGHASAPPKNTPIARLAAFMNEFETKSPFKKSIGSDVRAMFVALAPYAPFYMKLLFGNFGFFSPLLKSVLPAVSAQAGAMLKTTIAFTMMKGSDACNVLPQEASVCANMRFIPHQGMDESLAIVKKYADKYGLEMEVFPNANDYTEPVDINGEAYRLFTRAIEETFPELPHSPYVMTGATDSHYYSEICPDCLRFAPVIMGPEQMKGMHGIDENVEYSCLPKAVDFYKKLIELNK